ncbi:MAG: APC family permease [Acidobacteria bacterium]|nr:APC family permease [Acidobacteriota bacterium]
MDAIERHCSLRMQDKLIRGLSRKDFTAVVINTIIGAGIFGLPAAIYAKVGTYSLLSFVVCALVIGLFVLCYAEVGSRFDKSGGPYLYAREAFGPLAGFEVGWLYWIVRVTTIAANTNLFVTYLGLFFPASDAIRVLLVLAIIALITIINLIGVKQSATATNIMTVGKLAPLIAVVAAGMFFVDRNAFQFGAAPAFTSFSESVLLLIYAFVGFESAVIVAGETKDPQRTVPVGLFLALAIVAILYIGIQIVAMGTVPELASSQRPIADAAAVIAGPIGAIVVTVGALVSILGNLNVGLLAATRLLFAMSEQGDLPRPLGKTSQRSHIPATAILLTSFAVLIVTLNTSFISALAISVVTRLIVYATTCLALPILRRQEGSPKAEFQIPAAGLVVTLSLVVIIWLLTNADLTKQVIPIVLAALFGTVIFVTYRSVNVRPR